MIKRPSRRHVSCSLWTDVMFSYCVSCESGQMCPGCGYCYDCLRKSIIQFKQDVSYLFCLKAVVMNKYYMFYIMLVQVFFFFCTRNDYYILLSFVFYTCICWQGNTVQVCVIILYVNFTSEETWWSLQLGVGKNVHIYLYQYWLSAKWVVKHWHIRFGQKNPILCIPTDKSINTNTRVTRLVSLWGRDSNINANIRLLRYLQRWC